MHRRRFLAAAGVGAAVAAGCVTVDPGGTVDVVINNCLDEDMTADVRIEHAGGGDPVLDETVTVPGMSCSDVVDGVRREDVFPDAGTYAVSVAADGYEPAEAQVEFSEREIEDNSDNVVVTIREEDLEIA